MEETLKNAVISRSRALHTSLEPYLGEFDTNKLSKSQKQKILQKVQDAERLVQCCINNNVALDIPNFTLENLNILKKKLV